MRLEYPQERHTFELAGGSRKSKASPFIIVVVVVVASALGAALSLFSKFF